MLSIARAVVGASALLAMLAAAEPASAQQTREEALAAERAQKALRLRPYEPSSLERKIRAIDGLLLGQRPFYPFIGSTLEGGGLAIGPGYRARFGDAGTFNAHAAWSIRNYKAIHADMKLPDLAGGRVDFDLTSDWLDAPAVASYGVGNDSLPTDKTSFALRSTMVGVTGRVAMTKFFAVGGGVDALNINTIEADPRYSRSRVFAEIDWRTSPGYTRRGGLYRVDWSNYQTGAGRHDFRRVDAEVNQFIPLLRENWVIALRGLVSSTETRDGNTVPVVLMPSLGGGSTLRGYPTFRFRDRNRLLLTGEYRWTAGPFVDMALFMDAGKVAPRFEDLDLKDLTKSYGIGATFHTFSTTLTRIELARTREGMGLSFSFGANF